MTERKPCQECGMSDNRAFIGTPICCLSDDENRYSRGRKIELAKAGCFRFVTYGETAADEAKNG